MNQCVGTNRRDGGGRWVRRLQELEEQVAEEEKQEETEGPRAEERGGRLAALLAWVAHWISSSAHLPRAFSRHGFFWAMRPTPAGRDGVAAAVL